MKREFQVGNRVNVYGFDQDDAAKILRRTIVGLEEDGTLETDGGELVHPKQCRRLKKKNSREFWISPIFAVANSCSCACKNEIKPDRCKEAPCIRVREVKAKP